MKYRNLVQIGKKLAINTYTNSKQKIEPRNVVLFVQTSRDCWQFSTWFSAEGIGVCSFHRLLKGKKSNLGLFRSSMHGNAHAPGFEEQTNSRPSRRHVFGVLTTLCVWFAALIVGLGGVPSPIEGNSGPTDSSVDLMTTPVGYSVDIAEPVLRLATRNEPTPPDPIPHSTIIVTRGDTLSDIFIEYGLSVTDLHDILKSTDHGRNLKRIYIGDKLHYSVNDEGRLDYFAYQSNPRIKTVFERSGEGFVSIEDLAQVEHRTVYKHVVIGKGKSPISAGLASGIQSEETIVNLTRALEWDIDFWHDIRPNDEYRIFYDEEYLDGEYYKDGQILALEFVNRGTSHKAYFFEDNEGSIGFYFPDGTPTRKRWLKAPLEYSRISSSFNPRRLHPILKVTRPHNGIDYAAPMGTPVRATSDGSVRKAGYARNNGNYVFVTHDGNFETRYLHLQKFAGSIKRGTEVTQGEIIGWVGRTGLATGPHLHYEILHNGRHTNPRHLKIPPGKPLTGTSLEKFKQHVVDLKGRMHQEHVLALKADANNVATTSN